MRVSRLAKSVASACKVGGDLATSLRPAYPLAVAVKVRAVRRDTNGSAAAGPPNFVGVPCAAIFPALRNIVFRQEVDQQKC